MRRLNLPFKTMSQNSVGKGSGSSGECISASAPGICGGVGCLLVDPVADNVSGFTEKLDGLGKRSFDGPGVGGWLRSVCHHILSVESGLDGSA